MKLEITKEWMERMAKAEEECGDISVIGGRPKPPMLVYLSGPITPKNGVTAEEHVASALKVYLRCVQNGIPAICPQLSGAFPSCWTEVTWEQWMAVDLKTIEFCTHMLMLPGWDTSVGALKERAYAQSLGIPVYETFVEWAADYAAARDCSPMDAVR